MRAFQIAAVIAACVTLSACASKHEITSSTPRTVEIKGTAWDSADNQKAFDMAQAQCQKQGRHAALAKDGGSKPNAWWVFDCVL